MPPDDPPGRFLDGEGTSRLYRVRFDARTQARSVAIWRVLCRHFFQRYVPETAVVVDVGAGYCDFINQIRAARRIAVDMNPETRLRAAPGVEVIESDIRTLVGVPDASVDVVFCSNVLEHLPTKGDLMATLSAIKRVLRPGGSFLVMGPNIRFAPGEYWDFLDHHIALSDRSVAEALETAGFRVTEVRPRFLPLSKLSRLPQHPALVWLYLKFPPAHRLLGKQLFIVARC
ncbi:MAG: class I SAM-dependent methyltransferase [Armatimonadota bacterium]|nr:class I SAM-dependent methyltransferase [Armatimonadota bacterium]